MNKTCHKKSIIFILMACMASCWSCASMSNRSTEKTLTPTITGGAGVESNQQSYDYLLDTDDSIRIVVEQHAEWSGEFIIRPDGNIAVPSIGEIRVAGLSKYGAEIAIASQLEKYITNPKVTVDIVRYASQAIYVLGDVERPGKYSTEGKNITLRDAITMAGFPSRFAATGRVFVITPSRKRPKQQVINLDRILYRGELKMNVQLKPGDIVFVPKSFWGQVSDFLSIILSPLSTTVPAARAAIVAPVTQ